MNSPAQGEGERQRRTWERRGSFCKERYSTSAIVATAGLCYLPSCLPLNRYRLVPLLISNIRLKKKVNRLIGTDGNQWPYRYCFPTCFLVFYAKYSGISPPSFLSPCR